MEFTAERVKQIPPEPLEGIEDALSCTYLKPDAPWALAVYRVSDKKLNYLLPRHRFMVMDDRSQFDGATPDQVRQHFTKWALDEFKRNWWEEPMPDDEVAKVKAGGYSATDYSADPRYSFCLLVDDICLESFGKMLPVVKLVKKHWEPGGQDWEDDQLEENPGWEGERVMASLRM
ncbi:hypothetical protein C8A03DRAFT_36647 [Achaetomium macrosporum]|uniref:Uncharacterized protein n=1 Tax=Achaetomium macrosporum TaxID=79813 RepID=A0AAN7H8T0_9PEZI|nr:hypothetical protein C8A03DRAFT_36647 [Achaetomium macrosporum]